MLWSVPFCFLEILPLGNVLSIGDGILMMQLCQLNRANAISRVDPTVRSPRARLLAELPAKRYRLLSGLGRAPRIGDILVLDQGFTDESGVPMVLAYFPDSGYGSLYEADVYESELEDAPPLA